MPLILYVFPAVVVILIGIRKYRVKQWGKCASKAIIRDKVVIITGANSGIGYEVAENLAIREATIILACRNMNSALETQKKITNKLKLNLKLIPMELNLASLRSIEQFVQMIKMNFSEIHILINNAGVAYPDKTSVQTDDGFEIHFGVNHLGHFFLTNLLLNAQLLPSSSRIVIVSSTLHEKGRINLDDLNSVNTKERMNGYSNSKLANVYFGRELAKHIKNQNINVYILCPGWVYTNLFRNYNAKWYNYVAILPVAFFFMRSPQQGAQTVINCAVEPSLSNETGYFYRDCKKFKSKIEFDDDLGAKLWEASSKIIKEKGFNI